jgi:DNA replication protein DnaC
MDTWSGAESEAVSLASACPVCQGVGFIYTNVPVGHPDFGKAVPCRCTRQESEKEHQTRLEHYSNLGALSRLTFDNLIPEGRSGDPNNQERFTTAYQAAKAFAVEPKGWLVLAGPSGCGKTHLAAAIANERISRGYPAFFITTPDLLQHLRSAFSPDSEIPYDEFFNRVRETPLLILDDLGAQSSTPWAKEKLDQLLTHRFNSQLPTVIVTITPIEELEERMCTRLTDPALSQICVIEEEQPVSLEYSWGPEFELQKTMTFDNFDWRRVNLPPDQRQNLELVFRTALEFAKSPDGWLVLQGETGCGKTHLAAAIVNYCYQAHQPAMFVVVPDFLDHLRATFTPESKVSYDQLFESVKKAPLLILDDFGEQSTTPWAREKLYQVINYRYNARLPTVITARCSLDEIDSPISSRLAHGKISVVWNIIVPDYRTDATSSRKKISRGGRKGRWDS